MEFGICTSIDNAPAARAAGWDYVEEGVQALLQGLTADEQWQGLAKAKASALPAPAANLLVPASLKITGPDADLDGKLRPYLERVTRRANQVGMQILVFGSGGARNVPDGFDRDRAKQQIIDFARVAAELAGREGVTIVAEPLNRGECNVINSVAEAMEYVRAVDHPNFRCLVDSYHLWLEDEPLENVAAAMPWIAHVHVADKDGRVAPGESGSADYRPLFGVLRRGGYRGRISVEASNFDVAAAGQRVLRYLKDQWSAAAAANH
jgi:sugar phosphate isomerase/epimerase